MAYHANASISTQYIFKTHSKLYSLKCGVLRDQSGIWFFL